ncbi:MAG: prephenate dehydrogenase/arogenate dehydrogenase family protein [Polyangiaceae bacterium]|nr:prephenate dehydrogenase/arogenate dehydrogenase family protein [Polyangiaceae bacterium]
MGANVPCKRAAAETNATIAILGYGRFGRALASLFVDAGADVRAYDARASIPVALVASSPEYLVRGASHVILAVPIDAMRTALEEIAPFLDSSQIVLDVGSVKVGPVEVLAEVLGNRVPWVGTHPLFGPTSLALAERPLRVVVCPNSMHPDAAVRARALYEAIGCEILEETAELHDRRMAETHALAFFVAKGVLEANMGLDVPNAPPSFQAITRTVDVVRSDAGHLFAAIQRENPYAAAVRKKFIEALIAIDARLAEEAQTNASSGAVASDLAIGNAPAVAPDLRETRDLIDDLDRELMTLLGRRMELARRARRAKARLGLGIVDSVREAELLVNRRAWAIAEGLDPEGVGDIFEAILRISRRTQLRET